MKTLFYFIFIFTCLNSFAQNQDSTGYDPSLIGNWGLSSIITMNYDGTLKDTIEINQESVYWNVRLQIDVDSIQENLIPTGKKKDLPEFEEKCKWSIYKEEEITWITFPCGSTNIRGTHEIVYISETELLTLFSYHEEPVQLLFLRIE